MTRKNRPVKTVADGTTYLADVKKHNFPPVNNAKDLTSLVGSTYMGVLKLTPWMKAINERPQLVVRQVLDTVCAKLEKMYPKEADYFTSPDFVEEFVHGVNVTDKYFGVEELSICFDSQLPKYPFHTSPRIPDLMRMIERYNEMKTEAREIFHREMTEARNQSDYDFLKYLELRNYREAFTGTQMTRERFYELKREYLKLKKTDQSVYKFYGYKLAVSFIPMFLNYCEKRLDGHGI